MVANLHVLEIPALGMTPPTLEEPCLVGEGDSEILAVARAHGEAVAVLGRDNAAAQLGQDHDDFRNLGALFLLVADANPLAHLEGIATKAVVLIPVAIDAGAVGQR